MNIEVDQKYFYIAYEGLKAELPEEWIAKKNSENEIFYENINTKV